jgi:ABC-type antimicrobial peptide transport system permease subunit
MALGAERRNVMRLRLSQSTLLTVLGAAFGLAGSAAVTRYLQAMLFGLTPLDPATFVTVPLALAAIAGGSPRLCRCAARRGSIPSSRCTTNDHRRRRVDYREIRSESTTRVTPAVSRASATARSCSAWELTVPPNVTVVPFVVTSIARAFT